MATTDDGSLVKRAFDPSGSFSRSEFAIVYFGGNGLFLVAALIDGFVGLGGLSVLFVPLLAYVFIASGIRRLHDRGNSGWLILLVFVPFVYLFMLLYLLFAASHRVNPIDKAKAVEALRLWDRHVSTIDNATDKMRLAAAEDPNGMHSESFEEMRLAAVGITAACLEETKDGKFWPELEDQKGFALMSLLRASLNDIHSMQLDSLRLQRESVEASKSSQPNVGANHALSLVHERMSVGLTDLGRAASRLMQHYSVKLQEISTDSSSTLR